MSIKVLYSDNNAYCCEWLRNLIAEGLIPEGYVDERDIENIQPEELNAFTQVHLFCGIAGWPYALRLTDWGDRPVWTGSCPCQPWSGAGKRAGTSDKRHLWPAWFNLIRQCRPPIIFGEQVASLFALQWYDALQTDLEGTGYAVGAADLCVAGVSAPHLRQRLWFVAERVDHSLGDRRRAVGDYNAGNVGVESHTEGRSTSSLAHPQRVIGESGRVTGQSREGAGTAAAGAPVELGRRGDVDGWMGSPIQPGLQGRGVSGGRRASERAPWASGRPLWCRDGKWRLVEPSIQCLVNGTSARVDKLRAIGNSICPQVAAEFVAAYLETEGDRRAQIAQTDR